MWFVLHCPKGNETEIVHSCKQHIPQDILTDAFTLTYRCLKKRQGVWQQESMPLFPEYVFLESQEEASLSKALERFRTVVHVLEDADKLSSVCPGEEEMLKTLCSSSHEIKLSRGYIRGSETHVTEGPLQGYEKLIKKIDRHRRLAWLELPILGDARRVKAGLEIYEKS